MKNTITKQTIQTVDGELEFKFEVNTIDEAQAQLNYFRNRGYSAACLHENGKHQVYATPINRGDRFECVECKHKFYKKVSRNAVEVRCPKCHGYDTELNMLSLNRS